MVPLMTLIVLAVAIDCGGMSAVVVVEWVLLLLAVGSLWEDGLTW